MNEAVYMEGLCSFCVPSWCFLQSWNGICLASCTFNSMLLTNDYDISAGKSLGLICFCLISNRLLVGDAARESVSVL